MKQITLFNKAEFASLIGVSPSLLRKKELNGELQPHINNMYSSDQVDDYLKKISLPITVFASNIQYLMKKHNITNIKLSKETGVVLSTITRMLSGDSKTHRKDTVIKISDYFGYRKDNEYKDMQYKYLRCHDYKIIPILENKLEYKKDKFIKYPIEESDIGKIEEFPDYAITIPKQYQSCFPESIYIAVIISQPILTDTVIFKINKSYIIGIIKDISRSHYSIDDVISSETYHIDKTEDVGIVKTNI